MYDELLEECDKKKELMNKLKDSKNKLDNLKKELKKSTDEVFTAKRKLDVLQYDLGNLIRNENISDWSDKLPKLYQKHFNSKIKQEYKGKDETLATNTFGTNPDEEMNIKEELLR